ncbi:MAG: thioesterase [Bacteroidia bacterium]|jgi:medium-chain acyl-[acyl-carrier-protein] hydrolase|nr:thioesterase [Bacteroidia bacterium]
MVDLDSLPHRFPYQIRPQELGPNRRMTMPAMINLLQDAAWFSAAALGVSVFQLNARGVGWVLSRLVWNGRQEMPGMGAKIVVETYPSGIQRSFLFRDFRVFAEDGNLLGTASSTWVVMDLETRKMISVADDIVALVNPPDCVDVLDRAKERWKDASTWSMVGNIHVGWHDLDLNGHVNHGRFVSWLGEALSDEQLNHTNVVWDLIFRGEALRGDELVSEAEPCGEGGMIHRLRRGEEVLVRAKSLRR